MVGLPNENVLSTKTFPSHAIFIKIIAMVYKLSYVYLNAVQAIILSTNYSSMGSLEE